MHVRETIEKDGVGMRWVRTAATTVTAVFTAGAALAAGFIWFVEPRAIEWTTTIIDGATAEWRAEFDRSKETIDRLDEVIGDLETGLVRLEAAAEGSSQPSFRFSMPDTTISDGSIGGVVTIQAGGVKLRDCGVPVVDLYFINGGGIYHRFEAASVITPDGRGVALPVDAARIQSITYIARIPADDGVAPGRAQGFISVSYPDACPQVPPAVAGPLQFRISA